MKILHIDTAHTWRGGQNQVYLLLKYLYKYRKNVKNYLLTPFKSALSEKIKKENLCEVIEYSSLFSFFKNIRKFRDAIIHCHTSRAHTLALISSYLFSIKNPIIVHRRVDFIPSKNFINKFKYKSSRISAYIAISKCIRDILLNYGIEKEKVFLVYSGVDFEYLDNVKKIELKKIIPMKDETIFINIGALTDHKGQIYLLKAAKLLKDKVSNFKVLICGEGELREEFEKYIRKNNLENFVYLLGFRKDAHSILKSSDFFVMSSHLEGLGTIIIDAMYLKKLIIASNTGGIKELIFDKETGLLVHPKDVNDLYKKMLYCIKNKKSDEVKRIILKAHKYALENFSYETMGKEIYNIYEKVKNKYLGREK